MELTRNARAINEALSVPTGNNGPFMHDGVDHLRSMQGSPLKPAALGDSLGMPTSGILALLVLYPSEPHPTPDHLGCSYRYQIYWTQPPITVSEK